MPSTPSAYLQVVSRRLTSFRVVESHISAVQGIFCDGFDSRQLHSHLLAHPGVFVIASNALALSDCLNIQWTT